MTLVAPKKPHHSHRKRTGKHQRRHKHFTKTYWPYLPLLLIVSLGIVLNSMWPSHHSILGYATDMSVQGLLTGTNDQRAAHGENELTLNSLLSFAAQNKANDMAAKDYWSHNTPSGQAPWSFITAVGYDYQTAGENLAYGFDSSGATITGWMNSPGHRANILNSSYTNVGFGVVNIPNYQGQGPETLVVAMYGSPVYTVAAAPSNNNPAPTPTPTPPAPEPVNSPAVQPQTPPVKTASEAQQPSDTLTPEPATPKTPAELPAQRISRIQLVANGGAAWSLMATLVIVTVALVLLLIRHGYAWHKLLIRGERFVLHHPVFDFVAVSLVTVGIVLSHTAGVIR